MYYNTLTVFSLYRERKPFCYRTDCIHGFYLFYDTLNTFSFPTLDTWFTRWQTGSSVPNFDHIITCGWVFSSNALDLTSAPRTQVLMILVFRAFRTDVRGLRSSRWGFGELLQGHDWHLSLNRIIQGKAGVYSLIHSNRVGHIVSVPL